MRETATVKLGFPKPTFFQISTNSIRERYIYLTLSKERMDDPIQGLMEEAELSEQKL